MMELIKQDLKCSYDVALAWAVCAKNCLINVNGFSSAQLVFGRNSSFPSTVSSGLPALESFPENGRMGLHISALYSARRAFMAVESDEKIKRALRRQTRVASSHSYQPGSMVYYRRDTSSRWKGPAKILAVDGPVHWLRHGSYTIKVHSKDLQYVNSSLPESDYDLHNQSVKTVEKQKGVTHSSPSSLDNADSSDEEPNTKNSPESNNRNNRSSSVDSQHFHIDNGPSDTGVSNDVSCQDSSSEPVSDIGSIQTGLKLKKNQVVTFDKSGEQFKAVVLKRAGKATGKYKNEFNVQYMEPKNISGQMAAINFETVDNLAVNNSVSNLQDTTPVNIPETTNAETEEILEVHDLNTTTAKENELDNWKRNSVYKEVPISGQKLISLKWVHTIKELPNGDIKAKARLVARGFEENTNNN